MKSAHTQCASPGINTDSDPEMEQAHRIEHAVVAGAVVHHQHTHPGIQRVGAVPRQLLQQRHQRPRQVVRLSLPGHRGDAHRKPHPLIGCRVQLCFKLRNVSRSENLVSTQHPVRRFCGRFHRALHYTGLSCLSPAETHSLDS